MVNIADIFGYLGTFIGTLGGAGWIINAKAAKRKAKAEADRALIDNYEARLTALHETVRQLNETEQEHAQRIRELNHALDDKTEQIRKLTANVWESQQEVNKAQEHINRLNERIIVLTEERDHYKAWHCQRHDCQDPRGPKPPRQKTERYLPVLSKSINS